jgi:3-oxoacyl-[acyl-carrier protein] reductase
MESLNGKVTIVTGSSRGIGHIIAQDLAKARVFAKEIGDRRITVNSISPGPTNTELFLEGKMEETIQRLALMTALGRMGELEDIARVVLFLVSDAVSWITGQNI